ncbi:MAG TPA: alkaline phosphatase family protein, partial [Gemmatimonadaceae bacterium]
MPVIILVADGARPDALAAAMDDGTLPALARLRAEGAYHAVTSAFPSVTGPAYAPFLMGRYPGPIGLPGLRWFDRERRTASFPHYTRSYVGSEMRKVDRDLDPSAPTLFELTDSSLAALNVIGRGLRARHRLGRGARFVARAARTHFSGNVRGWLAIDREIGGQVVRRVLRDRPEVTFCALTGIDKTSHSEGHDAPVVRDAMRIVDETAAALREGLERAGTWERTHLWIVSDHGHSPVAHHEDLAGLLQAWGHGTISHPWVFGRGRDAAVMVSGNAMAHLYLELDRRTRPWWPALAPRWEELAARLLARDSLDLLLLPHTPDRCEVRGRGRGSAFVERTGAGPEARYSYHPATGDPLGLGGDLALLDEAAAYEACAATDYPDALVQIALLAG